MIIKEITDYNAVESDGECYGVMSIIKIGGVGVTVNTSKTLFPSSGGTAFVCYVGHDCVLNIDSNIQASGDCSMRFVALNGGTINIKGQPHFNANGGHIAVLAMVDVSGFPIYPLPHINDYESQITYDLSYDPSKLTFDHWIPSTHFTGDTVVGVADLNPEEYDFAANNNNYVNIHKSATGQAIIGYDDLQLSPLMSFDPVAKAYVDSFGDMDQHTGGHILKVSSPELEFTSNNVPTDLMFGLLDPNIPIGSYDWYLNDGSQSTGDPVLFSSDIGILYYGYQGQSVSFSTAEGLLHGVIASTLDLNPARLSFFLAPKLGQISNFDDFTGAFDYVFPNVIGTASAIARYKSSDGILTDRLITFNTIALPDPVFKDNPTSFSAAYGANQTMSSAVVISNILNFDPAVDTITNVSFTNTTVNPGTLSINNGDLVLTYVDRGINASGSYPISVIVTRDDGVANPRQINIGTFSLHISNPIFPVLSPQNISKTVYSGSTSSYSSSDGIYAGASNVDKTKTAIISQSLTGSIPTMDLDNGSFTYIAPSSTVTDVVSFRMFAPDTSFATRVMSLNVIAKEPITLSGSLFGPTVLIGDGDTVFAPGSGLDIAFNGFIPGSDSIVFTSTPSGTIPSLVYNGNSTVVNAGSALKGDYVFEYKVVRDGSDIFTGIQATISVDNASALDLDDVSATSPDLGGNTDITILIDAGNLFDTLSIVTPALHGIAGINGSSATYSPTADFSGNDSFQVSGSKAGYQDSICTVSIIVSDASPIKGVIGDLNLQVVTGVSTAITTTNFWTGYSSARLINTSSFVSSFSPTTGNFTFLNNIAATESVDIELKTIDGFTQDVKINITSTSLPADGSYTDNPLGMYTCKNNAPYSVPASSGLMLFGINIVSFTPLNKDIPNGHILLRADGSFVFTPDPGLSGAVLIAITAIASSGSSIIGELSIVVKSSLTPVCSDSNYDAFVGINNHYPASEGVLVNDVNATIVTHFDVVGSSQLVVHPNGSIDFTLSPDLNDHGVYGFTYYATGPDGGESNAEVIFTMKGEPVMSSDDIVLSVPSYGQKIISYDDMVSQVQFATSVSTNIIPNGIVYGDLTYDSIAKEFIFVDDGDNSQTSSFRFTFYNAANPTGISVNVLFIEDTSTPGTDRFSTARLISNKIDTGTTYTFDNLITDRIDETYPHDASNIAVPPSGSSIEDVFGSAEIFIANYDLVNLPNGQTLAYDKNGTSSKLYISMKNSTTSWPINNIIVVEGSVKYVKVYNGLVAIFTTTSVYVLSSQYGNTYSARLLDTNDVLTAKFGVAQTPVGLFYMCANGVRLINNSGAISNPFLDVFSSVNPNPESILDTTPASFEDPNFSLTRDRELLFISNDYVCRWSDPGNTVSSFTSGINTSTLASYTSAVQITPSFFQPTHVLIETLGPPEIVQFTIDFINADIEQLVFDVETGSPKAISVPNFRAKLHFTITVSGFSYPIKNIRLGSSLNEVIK